MKIRIEYEITVDAPADDASARALAKKLTPRKWTVREVQYCTRLEQVGAEQFVKVPIMRVVAGEAPT